MQFPTKNGSQIDLDISYANNTNLMTKKKFLKDMQKAHYQKIHMQQIKCRWLCSEIC